MKISILLIFISVFNLLAEPSYSQSEKISLKLANVNTIENVISEIERTTDYVFIYNEDVISTLRNEVDVEVTNQSLDEILNQLIKGTDLGYSLSSKQITLYKDESKKVYTPVTSSAPLVVQQQSGKTITGKVTDAYNESLPGVTVVIKGTTKGTTTDVDGNFSLIDVPENAILQFSFVGMKMQEILIGIQTRFDVVMEEESIGLEEIVAVGYGTLRKRNIIGSMSTVSQEKFENIQVVSVSEALAGVSAGVQANTITGEPGAAPSIRVRGVGSVTAGNEPLYVIDGFPTDGSALSNFSVNDIESMTILKDASATAIYGSRGSNGVIIISTKRGKTGAPRVSFNNSIGFAQITRKMDILSPEEYVQFAIDAVNRSWEYLGNDPNDPFDVRPNFYQVPKYFLDENSWIRTNWQDEIYQTAPMHDHQLAIDGGNENTKYRISVGYLDQDGIIKTTDFKRYSLGVNIDTNISKKLKFSLGVNTSKVSKQRVQTEHQWNQGVVATAIGLPGFYGLINEDGSYPAHAGAGFNTSTVRNPMIFLNEYDRKVNEIRILANISAEYNIYEGLSFKSLFGIDNYDIKENYFDNNMIFDVPASATHQRTEVKGEGGHNTSESFDWLSENTFNYDFEWNDKHKINALLGFTAQKATKNHIEIRANSFPDNLVPTLNAGQVTRGITTKTEWSMLSYLARVNYAYKDKYFTSLTLRNDGSSRFGKGNKWGYFPSASLGWIVSEEDFYSRESWVNYLKLKASYGISGNNAIPNYGSIGLLSYSNYVLGSNIISGQVLSSLSNENLGWETSHQFNAGIEINVFNNRIQFMTDVYQSINDKLLLNVPVPSILGVTNALQNIGKVRNRGVEFNLTTRNIIGAFSWTTDFNLSFNRNIVLELGPEGTPILARTYQYDTNITQIGRPIGDFYGYVFEGVYNTQEEIDNRPSLTTDRPGDPIVKDVNGDGEITVDDRTSLGNYQPDFFWGLDNTFSFRNFDLRVLIQGVQGADVMDLIYFQAMAMTGRTNSLGLARERWRSPDEPGNGDVYAASIDVYGVRRMPSTFYIQDGSFIRIKNITLGYNFDSSLTEKLRMSGAKIYISAQNPFTFTNYSGYNPEISSYHGSALTAGVNYYGYPLQKSLTLGVNLTF